MELLVSVRIRLLPNDPGDTSTEITTQARVSPNILPLGLSAEIERMTQVVVGKWFDAREQIVGAPRA